MEGKLKFLTIDDGNDYVGPNSQVEHGPMGWGSLQEAPTQPAAGPSDELLDSVNEENLMLIPRKHVVPNAGKEDITPGKQIVHSPMGWRSMQNAPTQPDTRFKDTME